MTPPSAAVLLIGNELLSGRVQDQNLGYLARELWGLGVAVRRAVVVRDDVDEIARELRALSPAHDWVFTTGGVGPTHDDVTIAAVARAFEVAVVTSPELAQLLAGHFGDRLSEAHLRMAAVPEGAVLETGPGSIWPTVRIRNVIVLPGVPEIVQRKFDRLRERFRGVPLLRRTITLITDEPTLVPLLDRIAADYPDVQVGSYPMRDRVVLTFEGTDERRLDAAAEQVVEGTGGIPRG